MTFDWSDATRHVVDNPNENGSEIGCCHALASLLAQIVQLGPEATEADGPETTEGEGAEGPDGWEMATKPESSVPQQPPMVVSLESCHVVPSADHHQLLLVVRPVLVVTNPLLVPYTTPALAGSFQPAVFQLRPSGEVQTADLPESSTPDAMNPPELVETVSEYASAPEMAA